MVIDLDQINIVKKGCPKKVVLLFRDSFLSINVFQIEKKIKVLGDMPLTLLRFNVYFNRGKRFLWL